MKQPLIAAMLVLASALSSLPWPALGQQPLAIKSLAESAGKVWLFTLGPAGGTRVAEVGPIPPIHASQYLLRINEVTGAPGSATPVHTYQGSEAFFVLAGEQGIRSPHGVMRVVAGHAEAGQGAGVPMQVSITGSTELHALVMSVLDASKSFSSPATLP